LAIVVLLILDVALQSSQQNVRDLVTKTCDREEALNQAGLALMAHRSFLQQYSSQELLGVGELLLVEREHLLEGDEEFPNIFIVPATCAAEKGSESSCETDGIIAGLKFAA
jgi:hypothetical protein